METISITDIDDLGRVWLPWCVRVDDPTVPVRISDEPKLIGLARQLQVRDVADPQVRLALAQQDAYGKPSLTKIESIVSECLRASRPPAIPDSRCFRVPEGVTLMEGCHRSCALYLFSPSSFELVLAVAPAEAGWPAYSDSQLRGRTEA